MSERKGEGKREESRRRKEKREEEKRDKDTERHGIGLIRVPISFMWYGPPKNSFRATSTYVGCTLTCGLHAQISIPSHECARSGRCHADIIRESSFATDGVDIEFEYTVTRHAICKHSCKK
ncbi:hypothetical protein EVAR_36516_1 [Eumeta japonica]|uniref:Uncharacterized protein n=1 Tax=Eumeta variegata TaxID=151549 RepID=A0A4C1X7H8_EUMVA|nr:hypothetical protein EVAR_36516_1 [Eumeta japonica]